MYRRFCALSAFFIIALFSLSACDYQDYYSKVALVCGYTQNDYQRSYSELIPEESNLTPACKAALESILPFDETFKNAPPGFKNKVTEAFHVLVAYPMALPKENRIFGVAPYSIPLSIYRVFHTEDSFNKSLFNYVVNQIDRITYLKEDPNGDHHAYYEMYAERVLTIFERFWTTESYFSGRNVFARAAMLVHEARHGDGYLHARCAETGLFDCDNDLSGPFGMSVVYLTMLLHGADENEPSTTTKALSVVDAGFLGSHICDLLKKKIKTLPKELGELLSGIEKCSASINFQWVLRHEGLSINTY